MNSILRRLERPFAGLLLAAAACLTALAGNSAWAQTAEVDPPGRVARIAETFGQVWLYSPDTGEWIAAGRNRPVTTGDRLATDTGARLELSIGSTTLRLDSGSELEVRNLDDNQVALQLHNGSAALRVRDPQAVGSFEMTTTEGRLKVQAAGRYRFDRIDRSTNLTVYAGQAYYEGPGSALTLEQGQRGQFWIEANGAAQYSITDPVRDDFAGWNSDRDRNMDRVVTARYVSPEMTGAQDLDRYGRWEQSPDYGPIWFPRGVVSGWAPYSSGHWAWVRPWGWTWVDDAPWGFAPFHYGRWVYFRDSWCWAPGTFVRRPVYAPALVAWVGGSGVNVSISIGGGPAVGWFPLAPREVYVPSYHASPRYVREVNITHVTNITNITTIINNPNAAPRDFANRKYPNAVTVVPASVMTNREPVAPSAARFRDLAPVRALATQPARATTLLAPPVAAPPVAQRGLEARPFRTPPNATEEVRRGVPERPAQAGARPAMNATEPAQHGAAVVPPVAGNPDERRGIDRRNSMAVPPAAPPRPAAVAAQPQAPVMPALQAPPPAAAPVARAVPPPPVTARPVPPPPAAAMEERRAVPPPPVTARPVPPPPAAAMEERRGRDRREAAIPPPPPRAEAAPNVVPPQPHAAPPPPPQVMPRPVQIEPPAAQMARPAQVAHPPAAEGPRPAQAKPETPPGRDPAERGQAR